MRDTDIQVATIRNNIEAIRERIAAACARSGRSADEVTLIAVSKNFPVTSIKAAQEAGIADFGENRVQEFVEKATEVPPRLQDGDVTWHMIGHLQRNKARDVIAHADVFHALDSLRLAKELNRRAEAAERSLPCLVQINVSGESSKFGIEPDELASFLNEAAVFERLEIRGLMTLASPADDPEHVRPEMRLMRELRDRHREGAASHHKLDWLSMGMSGDFEVAIEEGATHVRIGSAIFGQREQF